MQLYLRVDKDIATKGVSKDTVQVVDEVKHIDGNDIPIAKYFERNGKPFPLEQSFFIMMLKKDEPLLYTRIRYKNYNFENSCYGMFEKITKSSGPTTYLTFGNHPVTEETRAEADRISDLSINGDYTGDYIDVPITTDLPSSDFLKQFVSDATKEKDGIKKTLGLVGSLAGQLIIQN